MLSNNEFDPYGLGVAVSFGGFDGSAPSGMVTSSKLLKDPAERRLAVSRVVQWLNTHRGTRAKPTHAYDEILTGVALDHLDQEARNALFKDIRANPKILAPDADHIQYKSVHSGLYSYADLRNYVLRFKYGIPKDELLDAYEGVEADIEKLLTEDSAHFHAIRHEEKKRTVIFPYDDLGVHVDQNLKDMWHAVNMPKNEVDLDDKLHAAGHLTEGELRVRHLEKSRQKQAEIKLAAGQKLISQDERRAKRKRYPQKLTNKHLLDQHSWLNPTAKAIGASTGAAASSSSSSAPAAAAPK